MAAVVASQSNARNKIIYLIYFRNYNQFFYYITLQEHTESARPMLLKPLAYEAFRLCWRSSHARKELTRRAWGFLSAGLATTLYRRNGWWIKGHIIQSPRPGLFLHIALLQKAYLFSSNVICTVSTAAVERNTCKYYTKKCQGAFSLP